MLEAKESNSKKETHVQASHIERQKTPSTDKPEAECCCCTNGQMIAKVLAWICLLSLTFAILQYLFSVVFYISTARTIFAVCKVLCMVGSVITFGIKIIKNKSLELDASLIMFLSSFLISFTSY